MENFLRLPIFIAEYIPDSNKRRKLSLKRRRKGPPKELFPVEGRHPPNPIIKEDVVTFDLDFPVEEERSENPESLPIGNKKKN